MKCWKLVSAVQIDHFLDGVHIFSISSSFNTHTVTNNARQTGRESKTNYVLHMILEIRKIPELIIEKCNKIRTRSHLNGCHGNNAPKAASKHQTNYDFCMATTKQCVISNFSCEWMWAMVSKSPFNINCIIFREFLPIEQIIIKFQKYPSLHMVLYKMHTQMNLTWHIEVMNSRISKIICFKIAKRIRDIQLKLSQRINNFFGKAIASWSAFKIWNA